MPVAPLLSASMAALAHSRSSIPNTKHGHSPLFHHHLPRNTNQQLSKHAPILLQPSSQYDTHVFTFLLTIHFKRAELQAVTHSQEQALPQAHCGASPKSLPQLLCKARKSSRKEKPAAESSSPCQLFPMSRKGQGLFPSLRDAQGCFLEISWAFLPKPTQLLGQASWLLLPTGTAGQLWGTAS